MSPSARRFFGCIVPLTLALFGCGTFFVLLGAGRAIAQARTVEDDAMAPVLEKGWEATVFYTMVWAEEPRAGIVTDLLGPDGRAFRRIVALPGDTVQIEDGRLLVNGRHADPARNARGDMSDFGPLTLRAQEHFVLADDRDFPDSREWGPILRENIFGSPLFVNDGTESRSFQPGIAEDWRPSRDDASGGPPATEDAP